MCASVAKPSAHGQVARLAIGHGCDGGCVYAGMQCARVVLGFDGAQQVVQALISLQAWRLRSSKTTTYREIYIRPGRLAHKANPPNYFQNLCFLMPNPHASSMLATKVLTFFSVSAGQGLRLLP